MNKLNLLAATAFLILAHQQVFAELKPAGTVQEYTCADNQNKESSIAKICFAQVIGEEGHFMTTSDQQGVKQLWRTTESDLIYVDISEQKTESYQVQYVGNILNSQLQHTIHTAVLGGHILKVSNANSQVIFVNGEIYGSKISASQFENFLFTLGTSPQVF